MEKYLEAIRKNVCSLCIDSDENGNCTLNEKERCAVELFLPKIIETIRKAETDDLTLQYRALKDHVCRECRVKEGSDKCYLKEDANCSLDRYYHIIVETVLQVDAAEKR
ncbi:MAG: hypothetical protein K9I69_07060 [Ignavibacteriales bacterium]|nr:hypothetical protein [Ignavibacteriales bacterium]MCF8304942.1 hypothetical protein [Ignavibacteriales bacterium]MCF8314631.1 hypothetical protein [Ignavibacteriales bacterium]MCF8436332.1 hypothetical protein [Ignavibacteriales bacterium]